MVKKSLYSFTSRTRRWLLPGRPHRIIKYLTVPSMGRTDVYGLGESAHLVNVAQLNRYQLSDQLAVALAKHTARYFVAVPLSGQNAYAEWTGGQPLGELYRNGNTYVLFGPASDLSSAVSEVSAIKSRSVY